jgi:hypothetical protein
MHRRPDCRRAWDRAASVSAFLASQLFIFGIGTNPAIAGHTISIRSFHGERVLYHYLRGGASLGHAPVGPLLFLKAGWTLNPTRRIMPHPRSTNGSRLSSAIDEPSAVVCAVLDARGGEEEAHCLATPVPLWHPLALSER